MSDTEYGLVEPFENDSLEFALGVEWALFRAKLLAGDRFTDLVTEENAERIVKMVERHGRFCEHHAFYPGWVRIIVGNGKS